MSRSGFGLLRGSFLTLDERNHAESERIAAVNAVCDCDERLSDLFGSLSWKLFPAYFRSRGEDGVKFLRIVHDEAEVFFRASYRGADEIFDLEVIEVLTVVDPVPESPEDVEEFSDG